MIINYEDDKENMPNESDYEDLPSMYKDEDDDVDDEDDDEDDDSIFTSEWQQLCWICIRYVQDHLIYQNRKVYKAYCQTQCVLTGKLHFASNDSFMFTDMTLLLD